MKAIPPEFMTTPIVYAVKNTYQIMVPVSCETVMWVSVGDRCFYDDSNGILRSASSTHCMTGLPVCWIGKRDIPFATRVIHERKPYYISILFPTYCSRRQN
ncbi:MAG: hypothetical protein IJZ80_02705 [Clostridia bacterium]|nr:hypothetical protein [Clostridia bacterium]